jgi:hypothetical protein
LGLIVVDSVGVLKKEVSSFLETAMSVLDIPKSMAMYILLN